jgi:hypothetical protein
MEEAHVSDRSKQRTIQLLLTTMALLTTLCNPALHAQENGVAQEMDVTNARVIEMTKLGLDEDVIISKIKSSKCSFQVADKDLVELKNIGVSTKVIAAMLEANSPTVARVFIDGKPVDLHEVMDRDRNDNYFFHGQHSKAIAGQTPEIILELPKDSRIDNYKVLQLDGKQDRRTLSKKTAIIAMRTTSLGENRFKIIPENPFRPGEYVIYVMGSYNLGRNVVGRGYDFTVELNSSGPVKSEPAPATSSDAVTHAAETNVNSARILEMMNLKLGDDAIIAKIANSKCSFQVADQDLVDLKKAGVSPQVIAAMVEAGAPTVTRVVIDKQPVELHSFAGLRGKHAAVTVGPSPEIILELPKDDVIGNYVLVQLDENKDYRALDLGCRSSSDDREVNVWYRNKKKKCDAWYRTGISNSAIRLTSATPLGENRFKLSVDTPLKPGEYLIYIMESHDMILKQRGEDATDGTFPRGFDFTVQ